MFSEITSSRSSLSLVHQSRSRRLRREYEVTCYRWRCRCTDVGWSRKRWSLYQQTCRYVTSWFPTLRPYSIPTERPCLRMRLWYLDLSGDSISIYRLSELNASVCETDGNRCLEKSVTDYDDEFSCKDKKVDWYIRYSESVHTARAPGWPFSVVRDYLVHWLVWFFVCRWRLWRSWTDTC